MPSWLEDNLDSYVFPLAVLLAKGKKIALVPIYMGFLYAGLDECVTNVMWSLGRYDVVSHIYYGFLYMFLWECFRALYTQAYRIFRNRAWWD